jgi:protein-histidine pros-kinase
VKRKWLAIEESLSMPDSDESAGRPQLGACEHECFFNGFLEAAPDAVVIIDGGGLIVQVNSQTEKLFGYLREELVGRPLEILMPERFRGSHVAETKAYAANPRPRPMGRGRDLFGLRKDGEEFPIDVSLGPLPSASGVLVASTIRDVTSHRRLEDELRRRSRALEEVDRQKDQFLSVVVHELRSPLSVLTLAGQILRLPQADRAVREQTLSSLERQTAHMARLVEDLLDLSRIRCGGVTLRREAVDLRTILVNAVEMGLPLFESRKHHLQVAQAPEPLWVVGDPTRLVQVVSNLLTNAAKYTPEGGHIWLSAAKRGEAAAVRIRDDGVGIPKEMLSRVFELFVQVEPRESGGAGGLGIGLAVVRHLVELHGGTVEATSDGPGKGSEFVLHLPLMPNEPNAAQGGVEQPSDTTT